MTSFAPYTDGSRRLLRLVRSRSITFPSSHALTQQYGRRVNCASHILLHMWHRTCGARKRVRRDTTPPTVRPGDEVNSEHGSPRYRAQPVTAVVGRDARPARTRAAAAYSIRQGVQLSPDASCREISVATCRCVLLCRACLLTCCSHLLVWGALHRYSMSWRRDSTRSTRLLCGSLRLKASPPRQPSLADEGGAKWQRGVSVGQLATVCLACLCCAGGRPRSLKTAWVADRRNESHIRWTGELALICHKRTNAARGLGSGSWSFQV